MAITIEPMITIGEPSLETLSDGWTVVTSEGSPTAQLEHTLVVAKAVCSDHLASKPQTNRDKP